MAEKAKTPRIRFKGYTDAWEQRKLEDYLDVSSKKNSNDIYGKTDVLSVSGDYGIVNQIEFQGRSFAGVSVSNYGVVHTGDIVYTKSPLNSNPYGIIKTNKGKTGIVSTLYAVYYPKNNTQSDFVQTYFEQYARMNNYMHPLVNKGAKNDMKVSAENALKGLVIFPKIEEQKAISELFTVIDNLITLHQRKCDKLVNIKKSLLEKMFPQDGQAIPKIRFKGYTDAWEQRKLGEIVKQINRTDSKSTAPVMMITAENGFICQSERYAFNNAGDSLKKYIVLAKGELAYNHGASKIRPFGSCFSLKTADYARIPFVYHCFSTEEQNPEFVSIELNGHNVESQLRRIVSSGARMDGLLNISFAEYSAIELLLPKPNEQQRIAALFANIDNLITLHQRKYKCIIVNKKLKIVAQNMAITWEQRKLGEVGKCQSGIGFPDSEQGGKSGIPFYKVSDMNTYGNESEMTIANHYVSSEQIETHNWKPISNLPAMFFAKVGAAVMLNRKRLCRFPFLLDNNTMSYSLNNDMWSCDFAKALFDTIDLTSLVQVGALPSYNAGDVEAMQISIPAMEEQHQIGEFFQNLDNLITLHQRKSLY